MAPQDIKQRTALETYMSGIASIQSELEELNRKAGDHFGVCPDEISWADVSDLDCVFQLLRKANNGIGKFEVKEFLLENSCSPPTIHELLDLQVECTHMGMGKPDAYGDWRFNKIYNIRCRDTGLKDLNQRTIYADKSGNDFVVYDSTKVHEYDWNSFKVCLIIEPPATKA